MEKVYQLALPQLKVLEKTIWEKPAASGSQVEEKQKGEQKAPGSPTKSGGKPKKVD
jgi:hypothetical protein